MKQRGRVVYDYGTEIWALKKADEKKLEVAEIRMLRWMCRYEIKEIRDNGSREIAKKVQESRLKWYEHDM